MTKSMKSLMMGAALAGFMAGNTMVAQTNSGSSTVSSADNGTYATAFDKDKHACKGRTPARARAAASPATTAARARTPARARAAAPPMARNAQGNSGHHNYRGRRAGVGLWPFSISFAHGIAHACQSIQRLHRIRNRHRPAGSALPPHPGRKAGRSTGSKSSPKTSWSMAAVR